MKFKQELPKNVETELTNYIDRIKAIKWFKPNIKNRSKIDIQAAVAIKAFGVEAKIEYRQLSTPEDWGAARDAAWGAA